MFFNQRIRRVAGRTSFGLVMLGAAAAALGASRPVAVTAAVAALEKAVNCTSPQACSIITNMGKGLAVEATSAKGTGIQGNGYLFGVEGTSSNVGVGAGVYGSAPSTGVYGSTTNGGGAGVEGSVSGVGTGVYGYSDSGYGLEGQTNSGYGLVAEGLGSGNGIYVSAIGSGSGLSSYTNGGLAIFGSNSNGIGSDLEGSYIGIVGRAPASGGYPTVLTDSNANDVFWVDGTGDVYYTGGLEQLARVKGGGAIKSFTTKTTLPTVEDYGTAELVNGVAQVRLDPTFAASIDSKTAYRVFVTPGGDTHGLFVATKTPSGFIVRESQAGRSTVTFDYRIVATALGQTGQRMAYVAASGPRATVPVLRRPAMKKPQLPTIK